MRREWLLEEDAIVLLLPLAGSPLVRRLTGRSKGSVIGRYHRLKRVSAVKRKHQMREPKFCGRCEKQLTAGQRRYCSVVCRSALAITRPYDHPAVRRGSSPSKVEYMRWYGKLPEVRERSRLLDNARYEAKERKCSVREVLLEWGEHPGEVKADYGATGA